MNADSSRSHSIFTITIEVIEAGPANVSEATPGAKPLKHTAEGCLPRHLTGLPRHHSLHTWLSMCIYKGRRKLKLHGVLSAVQDPNQPCYRSAPSSWECLVWNSDRAALLQPSHFQCLTKVDHVLLASAVAVHTPPGCHLARCICRHWHGIKCPFRVGQGIRSWSPAWDTSPG